jgi:hypothetical protein
VEEGNPLDKRRLTIKYGEEILATLENYKTSAVWVSEGPEAFISKTANNADESNARTVLNKCTSGEETVVNDIQDNFVTLQGIKIPTVSEESEDYIEVIVENLKEKKKISSEKLQIRNLADEQIQTVCLR